jgi:hypothetical protein
MATQAPNSYKDPFWSDLAAGTEQKLGLPSGLLKSVLLYGERSNADQVSEANAKTPFQIIPATRKAVLDKYGVDAYLSPQNAAEAAGLLLKESLQRNKGDIKLAAAEYHGGTNPKNWGPRTKSYIERVSSGVGQEQAATPATLPGGGDSTFQRVMAARGGAGAVAGGSAMAPGSIQNIFNAYSSGQMTPEEAADFEADVKSGVLMLPRGAALRGQQPAPAQGTAASTQVAELPPTVVEAYNTGRMTRQEMMDLEADVKNGMVRAPAGMQIKGTESLGVLGGIREAFTGAERQTPTTQALPDYAGMPELNTFSMSSFKSALGTMMTNPQETVQVIQSNFPGVQVSQDEKGNFVLQSSIDGQMYAIKPGFQVSDIPRAAGALAAFTPAGRAATLPGMALAAGGTQAAIEATQAATGGRFDTGEVATTAVLAPVLPAAVRGVQAVRAARAPVTPAAGPTAPAGAPMGTAMAPSAPAAPVRAAAPEVPPVPQSKTGTLLDDWIQKSRVQAPETKDVFTAISRRAQAAPDVDFELRMVKTSDVIPTQVGDDYLNASSTFTAEQIAKSQSIQDIRRVEDVLPIRLDDGMRVIDGNHRHAAAVLNKDEFIPALVPVGKGTGKVVNLESIKQGAPISSAMPARSAQAAPTAQPQVAAVPPTAAMTPQELATTARTAAEGGMGATRATSVLAGQAAPDPKVLEAARRLGIDEYLQPDHLTSNQAYRELAQAVKSIPGSQARASEIKGLEQVGQRADNLITEIGGTTDLSRLNQSVRTQLDQTVTNLSNQADDAYKALRTQIPSQTRGQADNVLNFVQKRADDLDGPENLSALEKMVRSKLTPKPIKDDAGNVIGTRAPTYALIDDVRRDVGAAARQAGPFADADTGLAKQLYRLIDDDQFALAQTAGQGESYRLAKSLVQMRKGFEDDMTSLFGRQLDQSLVSKLESATMSLSKGDADKLAKILTAIPKDMRQAVTASSLNTAFGKATQNGTLNFNTYAKWYEGLLANKQAYAALMANLPQPARKQLSDLYRVSSNVSKATRERITTGRIQAVQQELQGADNMLSNIYGLAKRAAVGVPIEAATSLVGLPGAGIASGLTAALTKGKTNALKAADDLIASPEFQRLAVEAVSTNSNPSRATVKAVLMSQSFQKFADEVKLPREMSAREKFIVQSLQAQEQFEQENQ